MDKLRQEILEKVKQYYLEQHKEKNEKFEPGENMVTFEGRVYDEKEMMNLVDAFLGFLAYHGKICSRI